MMLNERRRALMAAGKKSSPLIPTEYQQVDWIATNGAYIKSGLNGRKDGLTEISAVVCSESASTTGRYIIGSFASDSYIDGISIPGQSDDTVVWSGAIGGKRFVNVLGGVVEHGEWATVTLTTTTMTVNNQAATNPQNGSTVNYEMYILSVNANHAVQTALHVLIRSLTVVHNGVTAQYVPCYRKADGVIGMWRTDTEEFLTGFGNGGLLKGADV
jgi:hypothetical protein